ncbi:MAG: peroxiredoxin [Deltaproteobacteria bacterium]|jgi:peroxiredoxin Q/BCP|nr:peroxiredoxin [Deltaproteobacteria bacterium]
MLKIGDKFPVFKLPVSEGKNFSLKDLHGKYAVVYFYSKDGSTGCTLEAHEFSLLATAFQDAGATIVGVSPDSISAHERFTAKNDLKITLLSDPNHELLEKAGVWQLKKMYGREYMGVVRSTFILDPKGKILFLWTKVKAKGHAAEVLAKLKSLIAP